MTFPLFLPKLRRNALLTAAMTASLIVSAQDTETVFIEGNIMKLSDLSDIPNAAIRSADGTISAVSNEKGWFRMEVPRQLSYVLVAADQYRTDTLHLHSGNATSPYSVYLQETTELLAGVDYTSRTGSTEISTLGFQKMEVIGSRELMKAACCNLSESFETTPSVDVGFTDAVSGYKQIQMLGLTGSHTLFTRENIPDVRGLAAITGLTFTPGTFVESMQLSKGTGSVVNGFEGTAGQINVEWIKPFDAKTPQWMLNGYQSHQGRSEGNIVYSGEINDRLSTNLFLHGKSNWLNLDQNSDGFLDQPKGETFVVGNRWFYFSPKNIEIQGGIKGTYMTNSGGEVNHFTREIPRFSWFYSQEVQRGEAWAKIGYMNPVKKWQSMGLQLSGLYHKQATAYSGTHYTADQQSFYANYIYQTIINNTNHVIKFGSSFIFDNIGESFASREYKRQEIVPGAFAEYSYNYLSKFNVVAGLRGDYHNIYGAFLTPRLHLRYAPNDRNAIRASIGRAQRTANIFAENFAYMASNRQFIIHSASGSNPYGLDPEIAWNMGLNFTRKFKTGYREGTFTTDYYFTHFQNQVVVDIEHPREVSFYNLDGRSYAHSFQAQVDYEIIPRLDIRLAYRYYDVKTTYGNTLLDKPLISRHRGFVNLAYATRSGWKFDYTFQVFGPKRLPEHSRDGSRLIASSATPSFTVMNAQISKSFIEDVFEVYAGVENILGNMQHHMILMSDNTASPYFDASLIWGQAMGRNIYIGFRYNIPKK